MDETLVPDDYLISEPALHWNNIHYFYRAVDSPIALADGYKLYVFWKHGS